MARVKKLLKERVRSAVDRTGLSQTAFAHEAKIKPRTLQDVLGGKSLDPRLSTIQGVSERSGIPIDQLVFGDQSVNSSSFASAAAFLNRFVSAPRGIQSVIQSILYNDQTYLTEVSREDLSVAITTLSAALKQK